MAIKLKIPSPRPSRTGGSRGGIRGFLGRDPLVRVALIGFLTVSLLIVGFFAFWYVKYDRIIEQRFRGPAFSTSAKLFAAPHLVKVGEKISASEIAAELRHAGYSQKEGEVAIGNYRLHGNSIEVSPGAESYHSPEPATINVENQDPECDLNVTANVAGDFSGDVALNNNFGFGGTNACVVLRKV